jgi:hypothetical protein
VGHGSTTRGKQARSFPASDGEGVHRDTIKRELDDELRFHIERETEKYVRAGMAPDVGERQARLAFGGVDGAKEVIRDERGVAWLEHFGQDVRYAIRTLKQNPGFGSRGAVGDDHPRLVARWPGGSVPTL